MEQTIQDDYFGAIQFEREYGCYCCEFNCDGANLTLSFIVDLDESEIAQVIAVAKQVCKSLHRWIEQARQYAADKLLDLKNESWLEDDQAAITPEEFKSRIQLETISFYDDGDFDFWYNDGGIFQDRSIQLSGNVNHGFENVDIPD